MPVSFKIDENLPNEAAQRLRDAGHVVSTILDEGLGGASDEAVAEAAHREGRVLVTLDIGFADIRAYPPSEFPGLVVLRLRQQDKVQVLDAIRRLIGTLRNESVAGRLWIVEERRIRSRS